MFALYKGIHLCSARTALNRRLSTRISTNVFGENAGNSIRMRMLASIGGVAWAMTLQLMHAEGDDESAQTDLQMTSLEPQASLEQREQVSNIFLATPIFPQSASITIENVDSGAPSLPVSKPSLFQWVQYGVKMLTMGVVFAVTGIVGTVTGVALFLTGKAGLTNQVVGRFFGRTLGALTSTTVEVIEGQEYLESERPCVLLVNHQSGLDVFVMASICPKDAVIMAKNTLQWIPLVGLFSTYLEMS